MDAILPLVHQHGLAIVFLFVLLEQGGLPIPAVPALLVAGAVAAGGQHFSVAEVLVWATVASLIADTAWFEIGARIGRRVLARICRISLEADSCVRNTDRVYRRFGPRSLVVAKFIPGYNTVAPPLAGIAGTSLPVFLWWDAIGTVLWAGGAVLVGYVFAPAVDEVIEALAKAGNIGLLVVISALAAFVAYKWWWRWRFLRQLRMDRITVPELRALMDRGEAPLILDVRLSVDYETEVIPGAVLLERGAVGSVVSLLDETREAIVYCSCPNEVSAAQVAIELRRHGVRKVRPLLGGIDAWVAAGHSVERPERLRRSA